MFKKILKLILGLLSRLGCARAVSFYCTVVSNQCPSGSGHFRKKIRMIDWLIGWLVDWSDCLIDLIDCFHWFDFIDLIDLVDWFDWLIWLNHWSIWLIQWLILLIHWLIWLIWLIWFDWLIDRLVGLISFDWLIDWLIISLGFCSIDWIDLIDMMIRLFFKNIYRISFPGLNWSSKRL